MVLFMLNSLSSSFNSSQNANYEALNQQEKADSFYSDSEINESTAYSLVDQDLNEGKTIELKQTSIKINDYIKEFLLTGGMVGADLALTQKIASFATNQLGFCLGNWMPSTGLAYLNSFVVTPIVQLNQKIGSLFGSNVTSEIIIPAMCEEIEFRWFIQNILLKQLPKKVIEQISPDLVGLVDSLPAKVSRVTAAALFFAICHTYALDCPQGGGIYQLVGGLLYGTLYEFSEQNLFYCINLHSLYNLSNRYLFHS